MTAFSLGGPAMERAVGVGGMTALSDYHTFGAAVSEVEVDVVTGDRRVLRTDILFDCGRTVNPAVDIGQG